MQKFSRAYVRTFTKSCRPDLMDDDAFSLVPTADYRGFVAE